MGLWVAEYTVTGANFSVGGVLNAVTRPVAELSASEGAIFQTARRIKAVPRGAARIRKRMRVGLAKITSVWGDRLKI